MLLRYFIVVFLTIFALHAIEIRMSTEGSPIIKAIESNNYSQFKTLLDSTTLHQRYGQNQTLLHYASIKNRFNMVELLVKKGILIDAKGGEYDATALHEAIRYGNISIATHLVKMGANVNIQDRNGHTPLHLSSALAYQNMVKLLLSNGANKSIQDATGSTAYDLMRNNSKTDYELLKLLDTQDADDKKLDVNKYKNGNAVNKYRDGGGVNKYHIRAEKIELKNNNMETEGERKYNKDIGPKNLDISIGIGN